MGSSFELISKLEQVEIIAVNLSIRELLRLKPMYSSELNVQFAICISTLEDEDLETWKIYRILPDAKAREVECLRVIDESGEDYLYSQNQFVVVELPEEVQQRLLATVEK